MQMVEASGAGSLNLLTPPRHHLPLADNLPFWVTQTHMYTTPLYKQIILHFTEFPGNARSYTSKKKTSGGCGHVEASVLTLGTCSGSHPMIRASSYKCNKAEHKKKLKSVSHFP